MTLLLILYNKCHDVFVLLKFQLNYNNNSDGVQSLLPRTNWFYFECISMIKGETSH